MKNVLTNFNGMITIIEYKIRINLCNKIVY